MAKKIQCSCGRTMWLASADSQARCQCGKKVTAAQPRSGGPGSLRPGRPEGGSADEKSTGAEAPLLMTEMVAESDVPASPPQARSAAPPPRPPIPPTQPAGQHEELAAAVGPESPIFFAPALGCHFRLPTSGWQRRPDEEEQAAHCEVIADHPNLGTVQFFVQDWKLDFSDLYEGVHEYFRKMIARFKLLGKQRITMAGLPTIVLEFEGTPTLQDTQRYRFLCYAAMKESRAILVVGSIVVECAETMKREMVAVPATFSFAPLPDNARPLQSATPTKTIACDKVTAPSQARPTGRGRGPSEVEVVQMAQLLLRGAIRGLLLAVPLALVILGLAPPVPSLIRFACTVLFLTASYTVPVCIGWSINPHIARLSDKKPARSAKAWLTSFLAAFVVVWLRAVPVTGRCLLRFFGAVYWTGFSHNRRALKLFGTAAGLYLAPLLLAGCLEIIGDQPRPRPSSRRSSEESKNRSALQALAFQVPKDGDYDKTVQLCTQCIALNDRDPSYYIHRAFAYYAMGQYDKVIDDCNGALRVQPGVFYTAYRLRGAAYRGKGDYDRAVADLTRAIDDARRSGVVSVFASEQRGAAYRQLGQFDRAIADLTKTLEICQSDKDRPSHAVELDPDCRFAKEQLALARNRQRDTGTTQAEPLSSQQVSQPPPKAKMERSDAQPPALEGALFGDHYVNLLAKVNLERDCVMGKWIPSATGIASARPVQFSRIMLPVRVAGEYDLAAALTRDAGGGVVITLPVGSHRCMLALGGWRGKISGLEQIDGRRADTNPTKCSKELINGRQYNVLVKVRLRDPVATIAVFVDEAEMIHWQGKESSLSMFPSWDLPQSQCPGLGVHDGQATFHAVQLRMVSGTASWIDARRP